MSSPEWPDAHVDLLRYLFCDLGLTGAEIARELNRVFKTSYSRNAAIGKVHRMGWVAGSAQEPKHKRDPKAPAHKRQLDASKSHPTARPRPAGNPHAKGYRPAPARAAPDATVAAFQRHVSGSCSWPIGDPRAEGFHFCGAPRARGAYCAEHAAIGYQAGTALNAKQLAKRADIARHDYLTRRLAAR